MKNSLRIHKWTHNEFNIFILGVLTHPLSCFYTNSLSFLIFARYVFLSSFNLGILIMGMGCWLSKCKTM